MSQDKYALPMTVNKSIGVSDYQAGHINLQDQNRRLLRSTSLEQQPEVMSN